MPLSLFSRYEAYHIEADKKVIYTQQLSTKDKKQVVNVANSGTVIEVSTQAGKNVTAFVTGSEGERDAFNAVQAHVLPTLDLLNRINQGKLGSTMRPNIKRVKGGRYRITNLEPITRSSESNVDNYGRRNPEKSAYAFYEEPDYKNVPLDAPTSTIPTGSSGSASSTIDVSSSSMALPTHPANNMQNSNQASSSNPTNESPSSGAAGLDTSAAQDAINNALENPGQPINIGDVYKTVK